MSGDGEPKQVHPAAVISLSDLWDALRLLLDDNVLRLILAGIVIAALGIGVLVYSLVIWRREKAHTARDLSDFFDRWRMYAGVFETLDPGARRDSVEYAVSAWLDPRLDCASQAHLYLLESAVNRPAEVPQDEELAIRLRARLQPAVSRRLGKGRTPSAMVALDHGIATALHLRPAPVRERKLPERDSKTPSPQEILAWLSANARTSTEAVERKLRPLASANGREWLEKLLNQTERMNAFQDWPKTFGSVETAVFELVLWKLHEQLIGPHAPPHDVRLLSRMRGQLPAELRSVAISQTSFEENENRIPELRVTFLENPWTQNVPLEISWHTGVVVRTAGAVWHTPRLELGTSNVSLVFTARRPANPGRLYLASRKLGLARAWR